MKTNKYLILSIFIIILIFPLLTSQERMSDYVERIKNPEEHLIKDEDGDYISYIPEYSYPPSIDTGNMDYDDIPFEGSEGDLPVREIIEPDIYRFNGNYMYVANKYRGVMAIDISNKNRPVMKGLHFIPSTPKDMYFHNNRAILITDGVYRRDEEGEEIGTSLIFLDISNPSNMKQSHIIDIEGNLFDSRMVGDVIYLVTRNDKNMMTYLTSVDLNNNRKVAQIEHNMFSNAVHITNTAVFIALSEEMYPINQRLDDRNNVLSDDRFSGFYWRKSR